MRLPSCAIWVIVAVILEMIPSKARGENQVTTFVITTQQERESTRFTLTEWLKIKERMKMMDLWLALFSEPAKDKFRPELVLFFGKQSGVTKVSNVEQDPSATQVSLDSLNRSGQYGRVDLWLTNLISGTVGIRTLNIDLGVGGELGMMTTTMPAFTLLGTSGRAAQDMRTDLRSYTVNLRVFGKNIQDSSLVFKYGEYTSPRGVSVLLNRGGEATYSGKVAGGELQLYLFHWLGFEGHYMSYGKATRYGNASKGSTLDYGLYIEVSLLRVIAGVAQEQWAYSGGGREVKEKTKGMFGGLKLSL